MNEKMSSLRFNKILGVPSLDVVSFGGYANAVLEHVFAIPREERGFVERIVYYGGSIYEEGVFDRIARVDVQKDNKQYSFYVFTETKAFAAREWKVTGRSVLLDGSTRLPNFDTEMLWFE